MSMGISAGERIAPFRDSIRLWNEYEHELVPKKCKLRNVGHPQIHNDLYESNIDYISSSNFVQKMRSHNTEKWKFHSKIQLFKNLEKHCMDSMGSW